jgi:hypothetical protein
MKAERIEDADQGMGKLTLILTFTTALTIAVTASAAMPKKTVEKCRRGGRP